MTLASTHDGLFETVEAMRAHNGLRCITSEEDGSNIHRLPPGVFGFTSSPALDDTPVYARRIYQSFEQHKLSDGSIHLAGYLTPADAEKLQRREAGADLRLYPEPYEQATTLVRVALDGVHPHKKGASRNAGNFLLVTVI